jgi:ribose-phosphate pyrophosphokinase
MRTYTLPDPTPCETKLLKLLADSSARRAKWSRFAGGEEFVQVSGARGHVAVIGRTGPSGCDFFRTLLLVDTLRRSGAKEIDLFLPYFAYARQDRIFESGDAFTPVCLMDALKNAGIDRIVTADLHSRRIVEASPVPLTDVSILPELAGKFRARLRGKEFTAVAPDHGSKEKAQEFCRLLGDDCSGVMWMAKTRKRSSGVRVDRVHGKRKGKIAVIVDDMLDTGGTVIAAAAELRHIGFTELHLCITHALFSAGAHQKIDRFRFKSVVVSDTVPLKRERKNMAVVAAAPALARGK